jgi:hypothetical protein
VKGITFRAQYVPLILAGEKTTTIRRPSNRLPVTGDRVRLVCRYDRPPFALATVTSVYDVTADEITEAQARDDGFATLAELLAALEAHSGAGGPDALPAMPAPLWRIITFSVDATA